MSSAQIVTVGDNTIDVYSGRQRGSYVGGNALNVAVQLRRHQVVSSYFGAVGMDDAGRRIISTLQAIGVGTRFLRMHAGSTASTRIWVAESGERHLEEEEFGVCATYFPEPSDLDALKDASAIHIGMLPEATLLRTQLAGAGPLLSQDCAVSDGFSGLDIAFSSAGADLDAGRLAIQQALSGGARQAVATCGAAGSVGFDGQGWFKVAAEPVDVVDTTGAGDSYVAGFLAAFVRGANMQESMLAGSRTAAETCQHVAAWPQ